MYTKPLRARPSEPDVVRFEKRIIADGDCWRWMAKRGGSDGYGIIHLQGRRNMYAHRWSYEFHRAPIPAGLEIDHLCHNPWCVNPYHLEPVTRQVNAARVRPALSNFCQRGHEFTPENTIVLTQGNGKRQCRTCAKALAREQQRKRVRQPAPRKEFCKNGHSQSGDNYVETNGYRVCRACRSLAAQATNAKRWGTAHVQTGIYKESE